ncbi:polyphosphate polymerase domain-containing protein [Arthrobacter sp. Sa2CUA1]|uniref:Polyphosphate polymerase domain-containing protein n=1 Tax=Arthrobacter gallicola TaxID=2762225 RepID=A0ABR8UN35_9MICC|nr:polyphosphate polymerase domain-containing protein [Arthrobacter gallicola]MBD7993971.1 polyphosphate polymerase domain-containing protein [Arthrobacter gallicola]
MSAGTFHRPGETLTFADLLPGISLEELNASAALQTRVDRKYLVDSVTAERILSSLPARALVLEMAGLRSFTYDSVYFDTPARESYLLAAHGRRRRYKIRTRTYLESALSFLEVKTEGARSATVKDRIPYCPADRDRLTAEGLEYISETLGAFGTLPDLTLLGPVLETGYARTTLYLPGSASRATIDTDVTWRLPGTRGWTLDRKVIVETKSGSTAGALDRHLWAHGVRPCRISKFATGLAALHPGLPSNRWHRTLTSGFTLRPEDHA